MNINLEEKRRYMSINNQFENLLIVLRDLNQKKIRKYSSSRFQKETEIV